MSINVSADLYRFIATLSVDGTGNIIENRLDREIAYISNSYTPNLSVSTLATSLAGSISLDTTDVYSNSSDSSSLLYLLLNSDVQTTAPAIYRYCQAVVLDIYSMVYAYESDNTLLTQINVEDIDNTINNCLYLNDYFSEDTNYAAIAKALTDVVVDLGVVKNYLLSIQAADAETVITYLAPDTTTV